MSFLRIDKGIDSVAQILDDSQVTVEKVQQNLQEWTVDETAENLKTRLKLETRTEQLAGGLEQAEALLDASSSTAEHVSQLLALGQKAGLPLHAELVAPLSEQISALQSKVGVARETAENLRLRVGEGSEAGEDRSQTRASQIAELAVPLLATFSQLDERMSDFGARTDEARTAVGRLNAKVKSRVLSLAILATLFFAWMAMGQVCLWRRTRGVAAPT
jgi:DNA anti-recombination protein RmuC